MFGTDKTKGLLSNSIEYIMDRSSINISVIEIFKTDLYDLTMGKRQKINTKGNAMNLPMKSFKEFEDVCN